VKNNLKSMTEQFEEMSETSSDKNTTEEQEEPGGSRELMRGKFRPSTRGWLGSDFKTQLIALPLRRRGGE
jgi:hypothetical protein